MFPRRAETAESSAGDAVTVANERDAAPRRPGRSARHPQKL